ncbi:MAG: outer membrane protein transport protein [Gammaproteobacteria bacterium]|nr:outer membrane protein transport protein [Gammaproteobacteria bacterium]
MRFSTSLLAASVGVIFAAGSTQVMATGFSLYEPDISTMGTAYAGGAATANNASVVAVNPAGMSRLDGGNITLNNTLILANTDIKNPSGTAAAPDNTNKGDMVPRILLGSAFLTYPHVIFDNMTVGIGLFASDGLKTNYESTFQGRAFGDKSTVTNVTLQPTVSYAFLPNFSAGVGLDVNHFNGYLTSGLSSAFPSATEELSGARNAFGYNVGFLYSPIEPVNIGLTYHSKVTYKLTGNVEVNDAPITGTPYTFDAIGRGTLKITTPDSVELAATYKIVPTVNLKASITRTMWSTIGMINPSNNFTAAGVTTSVPLPGAYLSGIAAQLNATSAAEALNFKDVNMYSVGADWQACDKLILRAGFAYDTSPVQKQYRTVRLPIANRTIYAVGANYKFTDSTNVDVAYNYLHESNAHIDLADATKGTYSADFRNSGNLIAVQLNHKF